MKILNNKIIRYAVILLIGGAIGAIFYPSKTITKEETFKLKQKIERLETEKKNITAFYEKQINETKIENRKFKEEANKKSDYLKEENFKLKQKVSEKRFKIVKPDGTIEEKWFKDSETDATSSTIARIKSEFSKKIKETENKYKRIHEQRIKKIKEKFSKKLALHESHQIEKIKKTKTEINKRSFGLSLGYTSNKRYFSSVMYDVYGPFFLNLHLESNKNLTNTETGLGIGMRW